MIEIKKGNEPEALKELRENTSVLGMSPKDEFSMLRKQLKSEVLESLKREQGYLCVYCMARIPSEKRDPEIIGESIEHYIPLTPLDRRNVGQALDYQNLFAVCHGNMRWHQRGTQRLQRTDDLTCDKHRTNTEFRKIHPLKGETLKTIYYKMNGEIGATDPDVHHDLTVTLNLNCATSPLVQERKRVLDTLIEDMGKLNDDEIKEYCIQTLQDLQAPQERLIPYVGVLIWYLNSMLARVSKNDT